jgi:predicted transcriptional regulator of viral defense system
MSGKTDRQRVLELARERGTLTTRKVVDAGIHTEALTRLVREGELERVTRGTYRLPTAPVTEHHGLALAAAAVPRGIVCLLSALTFHEIGTQMPSEVWLALDRRARRPAVSYPPLRIVRFTGAALTEGVETHRIEGIEVRITSAAKTVADLFKYRNKIGLDVALEALREGWRDRRFTIEELDRAARACRVEAVMRPYVEGVLS